MSEDDEKPIRDRLGLTYAPIPPWSAQILAPFSKVEPILHEWIRLVIPVDVYRPLNSKDIHYIFAGNTVLHREGFTLIFTPNGETTGLRMDSAPNNTNYYIDCYESIETRLRIHHIPLVINATMMAKGDPNVVWSSVPPPTPKKLTAKEILAEYDRRHKKDKKLTLVVFCRQIGANYKSIKAARWRYAKPKKRKLKRLP